MNHGRVTDSDQARNVPAGPEPVLFLTHGCALGCPFSQTHVGCNRYGIAIFQKILYCVSHIPYYFRWIIIKIIRNEFPHLILPLTLLQTGLISTLLVYLVTDSSSY